MLNKARRTIALVLALIVTFSATYLMVLPAVTLEKDVASTMTGLDLGNDSSSGAYSSDSTVDAESSGEAEDETDPEDSSEGPVSDASRANTDEADAEEETVSFDAEVRDMTVGEPRTMQVHVEAEAGAFPEGTSMEAEPVTSEEVIETLIDAVEGEVSTVHAVNISFSDENGETIPPEDGYQVNVTLSSTAVAAEDQQTAVVQYTDPEGGDAAQPGAAAEEVEPQQEVGLQVEPEIDLDTGNAVTVPLEGGDGQVILGILEMEEPDAQETDAGDETDAADAQTDTTGDETDAGDVQTETTGDETDVDDIQTETAGDETDPSDSRNEEAPDPLTEEDAADSELQDSEEAPPSMLEQIDADAEGSAGGLELQEPEDPPLSLLEQIGAAVEEAIDLQYSRELTASTRENGDGITVTARFTEDAFPEDVRLTVTEVEAEDYAEAAIEAAGLEQESIRVQAVDITFLDADGQELQPKDQTFVMITIQAAFLEDAAQAEVVHMEDTDSGTLMESVQEESDAITLHAESFSVYAVVTVNPGDLDNRSYGILNTKDGTKPSGVAMMSAAQNNGTKLQGKSTTVRVNTVNRTDYVYVANNSNITMWTFHGASDGKYIISTQVNGATKYLKLSTDGVSLADNPDDPDCTFTVTEGTGTYAGKYKFSTANGVLKLNGSNFERVASNNSADAWMSFAELSELNEDDFVTYTAQKVSISENAGEVRNGDMVILYTRIWNDASHQYDYYAVDYDGKLVKAYESGDTISWVGSQINTMLWDFTEYYYEGSSTPNGYYELQNNYSGKYIAPQTSNGSDTFLSDNTIGINLNGRGNNEYYTTILAWDDYYYASLKVDEEHVNLLSATLSKASDFYFAKMSTETTTTEVTTVSTVDNNKFGITLKMQDFGGNDYLIDGRSEQMDNILGNTTYEQWTGTKNLLQNYIAGASDYPVATYSNKGLDKLFDHPMEVNQQFLTSTYYETGYFEYDSTRNFAHLIISETDPWFGLDAPNGTKYAVGDFVIYDQLGTSSEGNKDTLRHGQFLPYNDLIDGFETDNDGNYILDEDGNPIPIVKSISKKYANTMDIHANPLSSLDPSYGKALYEIIYKNTHELPYVDHFFGMEMSASFMQSADGVDAWGHDLIFEFSGDDDFWLYVDGVLVLDLGGIHSALDGNVNFRTGRIVENGKEYWLKDRFEAAYRAQHANEQNLEENLQNWLKGIFKVETKVVNGEEEEIITNVFKDYSSHTMRMFYLERGAGASNIHMRFNISEYKEGRVQLEKKVSGSEKSDELFPFQIWYLDPSTNKMVRANGDIAVKDSLTEEQAPYSSEYSVPVGDNTLVYEDVFFLKAGQTVNIQLPHENTRYYIKECAMDSPATYDWVKINDAESEGSAAAPQQYNNSPVTEDTDIQASGRLDFNTTQALVSERKKVVYENHVAGDAMKNLTITKRLWQDENRTTQTFSGTGADADNTEFSFRIYIGKNGDGTYALYKNGPYRVKNPDGEYCYYYHGDFVSTGKTVFREITDDIVGNDPEILLGDTLQQRCTFHTGRGSVSKIKAGYTVEIPGLMNGTPFIVVERDGARPYGEIPSGYNRLGYEVNDSGFVAGELRTDTEDRETSLLAAGTINGDQAVTVHNQHGYSLTVHKVWSDAAFMDDHDEIYFAVYKNDALIADSVRQLGKTATSLSWFFPELEEGKTLNDYEVYEVRLNVPEGSTLGQVTVDSNGKVTGYTTVAGGTSTEKSITEENIIKITEGGTLTAGGTSNEHGYSASMEYVAGYSREVLEPGTDGEYPNTRTDTVTNSRPGIKIIKTDMNANLLKGAVFTLSKKDETDPAKTKTFVSDENGLVVVAYLLPDTEYTLTESSAPYGYQALIDQLTIKVDSDGKVSVNGSDANDESGNYTITQVDNPTATEMPTVAIRNKGVALKAVKIDADSERLMSGVKFALYKEVFASTNGLPDPTRPMPDYTPMDGYAELVTDEDGIIPQITLKNAEDPDGLEPGHYYLREVETPPGYISLGVDIRINLSATGEVTIESATRPAKTGQDWVIGTVNSDVAEIEQTGDGTLQITIKNTPKDPIRIKKVEMGTDKTLAGVKFDLYNSKQVENGWPKPGENPVFSDTTDKNGILNLGGLEGLYFLVESETLPGYNLLPGAIQINASAESNTVTAFLSGSGPLTPTKVTIEGKDVWEITVENSTGYELPSTGGIGTGLFTAAGGLMVLTAGAALLLKRRDRTA